MPRKTVCKWCEAGDVPSDGEHWIVKSLWSWSPAIRVYECKRRPSAEVVPATETGR